MTYQVPAPILAAHSLEHRAMREVGLRGMGAVELGNPARDPILRASSVWATEMMAWAKRLPPGDRAKALQRAANRISPGLGNRVQRIGKTTLGRDVKPSAALHRALQYAFADTLVSSVLELGEDAAKGKPLRRRNMFVATVESPPLSGLGEEPPGRTPEQMTGDIISGVICSDGVASLVGHAGGANDTTHSSGDRQLAAGLTELGFVLARGISGAAGHACPAGTTPVPAPPPPPAEPTTPPWVLPAAIGGGVIVIGLVVVVALRSR